MATFFFRVENNQICTIDIEARNEKEAREKLESMEWDSSNETVENDGYEVTDAQLSHVIGEEEDEDEEDEE
jgi:hypothetical protein